MAELYSLKETSGTLASTVGVGTVAWTNPGNAVSSNNTYATATVNNSTTRWLTALNWSFAVPDTARVVGVMVQIEKKSDAATAVDNKVQLWYGGAAIGDDQSKTTDWPAADTYITYGGINQTWGVGLDPAIVNHATFGVGISAKTTTASDINLSVDDVHLTVYYNTAITPPTVAGPGPHRGHTR